MDIGKKTVLKVIKGLLKTIKGILSIVLAFVFIMAITNLITATIHLLEKFKNVDIIFSPEGGVSISFSDDENDEDDEDLLGKEIELHNVSLYSIANENQNSETKINGVYYVYDGKIVNGFLRICQTKDQIAKEPINKNVTGWIRISDLDWKSKNK